MSTAPPNPSRRHLYRVHQHLDRNGHPYLSGPRPTCPYCGKAFVSDKSCSQHRVQKPECVEAERAAIRRFMEQQSTASKPAPMPSYPRAPSPTQWGPWTYPTDMPASEPPASTTAANPVGDAAGDESGEKEAGFQLPREYVEYYPSDLAGAPISVQATSDPDLAAYIGSCGPFAEPKVFRAAELLASGNLTNRERTDFLESELYRGQVPWHNNRSMMLDIDELPAGPEWSTHTFVVEGTQDTYLLHAYQRDIIQVIRNLISDSKLNWEMQYAPERQWTSSDRLTRIYNDMWTGDWWWELQRELDKFDPSGTIAALIVSSDKSCVSMAANGQYVYPVYVTLGNISKAARRKLSNRAFVLLGYLPVESFRNEPKDKRSFLRQRSVHRAMRVMFAPLREAWKTGVEMRCADGHIRRVHPTMAAFEGDWHEQCDLTNTLGSGCPMCEEEYENRGDLHPETPMRDPEETLLNLFIHREANMLTTYRLRPGWPFWAGLWPTNFHECIVPDLLHQIYIGVYKDHIVQWVRKILGKAKLDRCYAAMTPAHGLRHFNHGISSVQRWTGRESREMAKVILPIIADFPHPNILKAITALLNFSYLAHSASMNDVDLAELQDCLRTFHQHKWAIALAKLIGPKGWNGIPKLHMLVHYPWSSRRLGVPDGYSTETAEHLHIEYAKVPWRKTGRRADALPRLIKLLRRREALRIHRARMDEFYVPLKRARASRDPLEVVEEDDGAEDWEDVDELTGGTSSGGDYPDTLLMMGKKPHRRGVLDDDVKQDHEASELGRALQKELSAYAETESHRLLIGSLATHHHRFDIWYRLCLAHPRLSFARHEQPKIDVVRARPPTRSPLGTRIVKPGDFDTVLIEESPECFGIHRYRAARVRVIFRLTGALRRLYPHSLAFVELFAPFNTHVNPSHGMYTVAPALTPEGQRRVAVVPVSRFVMSCHLAPRFNYVPAQTSLNHRTDLLSICKRFYFNHYYTFFLFLLVRHWRRVARQRGLQYQ